MDFKQLAAVYENLENTSSGNQMREILAEFFKEVPVNKIHLLAHLVIGKFAPDYENTVLGIAEKSLLKALAKASGRSEKEVKELAKKEGDVGLAAAHLFKKKPMTLVPVGTLTIDELEEKVKKIISLSGKGSQEEKEKIIMSMLQKCSSQEAKYLSRLLLGNMRIGVADMTVLDSLAMAFTGDKKNKKLLERAYNVNPDAGAIAEIVAEKGLKGLEKIKIVVGHPIKVMLAQRVKKISEIFEKINGEIAIETKYDGERVQVHMDKEGLVNLYSRRMENITYQFPDIVEYLHSELKGVKDIIFEAEIIPLGKKGEHLHFQTLMKRKRKTEIEKFVKEIPVVLYCFDLLYLNGKELVQENYPVRIKKLKSIISNDHLRMSETIYTTSVDEAEEFFNDRIEKGYEGIMVKSQEDEKSVYKAGARDWAWIKWKKEYMGDVVDTYDLVVIGAFYGKGKRSGRYGSLLCATYNHKDDAFESVSKLGTGMTDKTLSELPLVLDDHKVDKKPARVIVKKEMYPDEWFEPTVVVEVLAAEITRGSLHCCAVKDGRGIALRFPRFIQIRDNKSAEQATTSKELSDLYER